jgi:hypothetical protein
MSTNSPASTLSTPRASPSPQNTTLTPLQLALVLCSKHPNAASKTFMKTIAPCTSANPHTSNLMQDNALYWHNIDGNLLILSFPATLDLNGSFGKTGPYFNLPFTDNVRDPFRLPPVFDLISLQQYFNTNQTLTPTHITKAKAQFELRPLTEDDDHPTEATECSRWAIEILQFLKIELENIRNNSMPSFVDFYDCLAEYLT